MNINIRIPWPGWQAVEVIGHGGYGTVYEIERYVFGEKEKAALKVISIPKEEWEIQEDYRNGFTEQEITAKYRELLEQYKNEYVFMMKMKGQSNVVSCEDIFVERQRNGYGYNVYIRMELLKPLNHFQQNRTFSEKEVIQIGKDICQALILCHSQNIIHRDIKPSNILRSPYGNYKLGDFGVSKVMEQTTTATGIGTKGYAAPEVFQMKRYGKTADIYSLGVVLYWLLNEKRLPFMEENETASPSRLQRAVLKRYNGEIFAPPKNGSEQLKKIVMKACMYEARERYQSAEEMLEELENLKRDSNKLYLTNTVKKVNPIQEEKINTELAGARTKKESPKEDQYGNKLIKGGEKKENFEIRGARLEKKETAILDVPSQPKIKYIPQDSIYSVGETGTSKKKRSKVPVLIGTVATVAVLVGGIFWATSGRKNNIDIDPILVEATATPTVTPIPELTVTPIPEPTATQIPEPTATQIPAPIIPGDISKGDVITLGRYEQDNDLTNGAEPIEWKVLDVQDGKALLLSQYGLAAKAYNENWESCTWETCTLRKWLSQVFMKSAFFPEEAEIIQTISVTADENPEGNADSGNDTEDQVFLLSISEADRYFENDEARGCTPTKHAIAQGAWAWKIENDNDTCWWWLRSPGSFDDYNSSAAGVHGYYIDYFGSPVHDDCNCVRPALWINLDS